MNGYFKFKSEDQQSIKELGQLYFCPPWQTNQLDQLTSLDKCTQCSTDYVQELITLKGVGTHNIIHLSPKHQ